jgi:single-stranded DNA-binding protein
MTSQINSFYFQGTVVSKPETRTFTSSSKTSFDVEQVHSYNGNDKKTVVTVQSWHKGDSHTQLLLPGDQVLINGKFSSSPYKERHILNLDAISVVVLPGSNVAAAAPAVTKANDDLVPF